MRKSYFLFFTVYCLLFAVFMWGCGGGGPGSPGSTNTEELGVIVDAVVVPTYLGGNTYSVDVVQDFCDPEYEEFTDHGATLFLSVRLVNPNATFQPGTLYVEKYTVKYIRSTDSIGAPPIESDTRYKTIVITPPTGSDINVIEDTVIFVDLVRKMQYLTDVTSGQYSSHGAYLNNYTAKYTFEGKNEFGEKFKFETQTDFQIGWFDNCGG